MHAFRRNPFVEANALNGILLDQGRHPGRVLVIAHRGASAEAPENTLAAIEAAIEIGADAVEFDIRSTFDNRLVLIHDEEVDRTTDGRGRVAGMTLKRVREFDAGSWFDPCFKGERIPRLAEALDLLATSGAVPIIEIKEDYDQASGVGPAVVRALAERGLESSAVVIARDLRQIARVKKASPETPVAQVAIYKREAERAMGAGADGIVSLWTGLTPGIIRSTHEQGGFVAAWSLGGSIASSLGFDPLHMLELARHGVDALVTNDPRSGLELVEAGP